MSKNKRKALKPQAKPNDSTEAKEVLLVDKVGGEEELKIDTSTKQWPAVKVVEAEEQSAPTTQEFIAVSAGKEEALCTLVRTSSVGYAGACRKLCWFSFRNTHLIVYTMFFLVLTVFSLYYGFFNFDKMLCIFAAVVALFMLYVTVRGHRLFLEGMAFDEERRDGTLNCCFYSDRLVLSDSTESYTVQYGSVCQLRLVKHYVYIRVRNNKSLRSGIIMEKPVDADTIKIITDLLGNK